MGEKLPAKFINLFLKQLILFIQYFKEKKKKIGAIVIKKKMFICLLTK